VRLKIKKFSRTEDSRLQQKLAYLMVHKLRFLKVIKSEISLSELSAAGTAKDRSRAGQDARKGTFSRKITSVEMPVIVI
jgi:hypothetical protein